MKTNPVQSKDSLYNDLSEKDNFFSDQNDAPKKINTKIHDLAIATIPTCNFGIICGHLIAAVDPKIVLNFLPKGINLDFLKKKRKDSAKEKFFIEKHPDDYQLKRILHEVKEHIPIGIQTNLYCNWVNALMQFLIFIPSLRKMFNYTPKSFSCFNDFIDTYICDREEKKAIASITTNSIFEFLLRRFSLKGCYQNDVMDLYFVIKEIMKLIPTHLDLFYDDTKGGDLLALHPSWQIQVDSEDSIFDEEIKKNFHLRKDKLPFELLVSYSWFIKNPSIKDRKCKPSMLLFFEDGSYYELDSFIEYRPDDCQSGGYLAYLKINGMWFQCDDDRVRQIRSNNLPIVLSRSFLFHYRKIVLNEMKKKRV